MIKKLFILILIMVTASNSFAAKNLTARQLHLATLASLEARGDLNRLAPAIDEALDGGVTINEIKEAFSQLYAYTGFPRSLNALGVLSKTLEARKAAGKRNGEGKAWERLKELGRRTGCLQSRSEEPDESERMPV